VRRKDPPVAGIIHFGACQDTEYASDAEFDGRPNGAFTYNFLKCYRGFQNQTYKDLAEALLLELPSYDYPQRPKLNATPADQRRVFLK
jgi:metacaspase-1